MTALARILSRASGAEVDVETLKTIAMFCGVGLFVSNRRCGDALSVHKAEAGPPDCPSKTRRSLSRN